MRDAIVRFLIATSVLTAAGMVVFWTGFLWNHTKTQGGIMVGFGVESGCRELPQGTGEKLTLHAQGSTPEDRAEFGSLDWEGKELPFRLEWASEGRMKVKVGIKSGGVDFQRQTGAKLFVSCSTGDFSFKNVRVLSRSTK